MDDLFNEFSNRVREIFLQKKLPKKIAVAVSGGCDSMALFFMLKEFCEQKNIPLFALTVDHKMRKNSSQEAKNLAKVFKQEKISHQILTIDLHSLPQSNIEAKLREMRYELMYDFCLKNKISYLFLGHQLDDVAENFLIRLFRGSGLDGLSAISQISQYKNLNLVRPLLEFEKDELQEFLKAKKIKWFEDETNSDEKFLRNKIRKFLNNFEEKTVIQKRIKNAADEISMMRDIINENLIKEASKILRFEDSGAFIIDVKRFKKLPSKLGLKILAFVLMEVGGKVYKPRLNQLEDFYQHLLLQQIKPRNFYGCIARQKAENMIIIEREKAAQNLDNIVKFDDELFLVDGRFLTKYPHKKPSPKTHKFYFRTILKEIYYTK